MGWANIESTFSLPPLLSSLSTIESPYCWDGSNLSRGQQPPTPTGSLQPEIHRNSEKKGSRKAILMNILPHIKQRGLFFSSQLSISSRVEASLSESQPKLATTCLLGCSSPSQRFITTLVQKRGVSAYLYFRESLDEQVSVISSFLGYR